MIFKNRKQRLFLSFSITTLFLIMIFIFVPIQFETNDDQFILTHFAGYITGTPTAHEIMFSTVGLGFVISRMYMLLPIIPWYTVFHLFTLWLSASLICFCLYDNRLSCKKSFWISSIGAMCFLFSLYFFATVILQFTTTPAMAVGAATVLLLNYKKGSRKNFIFTLSMMMLLMGSSYSMRPGSFYIGAALFVCIGVICLLKKSEYRRHFSTLIVIPFLFVGVLYIVNFAAYSTTEYKAFAEYSEARATFMDYPKPTFEEAPEVYINAGLDEIEADLIRNWHFVFDKVNIKTFQKLNEGIAEYYKDGTVGENKTFFQKIDDYMEPTLSSFYHTYCFMLMFFFTVIILAMSYSEQKKTHPRLGPLEAIYDFSVKHSDKIIAIGIIAFFCLANIYFVEIGRFPSRVYRALILVSAPSLLMLTIKTIQNIDFSSMSKVQSVSIWGMVLGILISNISALGIMVFSVIYNRNHSVFLPHQYAYEYAIENPENVYFSDFACHSLLDPFVVYPDTRPSNFITSIGSSIFSPIYMQALKNNGFDEVSQNLLLESQSYYMTYNLEDYIVSYYKNQFPEYEFVQVDEPHDGIIVYKLMEIN